MNPGAAAVTVQELLTNMQSLATRTILAPAELPATIVVIITYLVQGEEVVTIKQSKKARRNGEKPTEVTDFSSDPLCGRSNI